MGLLIVPIFLGLIVTGLSLVLANQVTEICRDTGHMFAYGVDFFAIEQPTAGDEPTGAGAKHDADRGKRRHLSVDHDLRGRYRLPERRPSGECRKLSEYQSDCRREEADHRQHIGEEQHLRAVHYARHHLDFRRTSALLITLPTPASRPQPLRT